MEKLEISLCMGSSCFARGNNVLLEMLENLIESRGWQDRVTLSGARCEDKCSQGPNIRINGQLYQGLDEGALMDLLEKKFDGAHSTTMSSVRRFVDKQQGREDA